MNKINQRKLLKLSMNDIWLSNKHEANRFIDSYFIRVCTVLCPQVYMGMTVNGAWPFEQILNPISTVGATLNLMDIGQLISDEKVFNKGPMQICHCISAYAMLNSSNIATATRTEFWLCRKKSKVILGSSFKQTW